MYRRDPSVGEVIDVARGDSRGPAPFSGVLGSAVDDDASIRGDDSEGGERRREREVPLRLSTRPHDLFLSVDLAIADHTPSDVVEQVLHSPPDEIHDGFLFAVTRASAESRDDMSTDEPSLGGGPDEGARALRRIEAAGRRVLNGIAWAQRLGCSRPRG
jgi:hypothetical protein